MVSYHFQITPGGESQMEYVPGMYFENADQAEDWLSFECSGEELEQAFYAENDRFHEWARWKAAYA